MTSRWTGGHYSLYRALLGSYLVAHFAMLLPYAGEMFGAGGTVAQASFSPLFGALPNPLALDDGPLAVSAMVGLGALCGVAIAVGWADRVGAILAALILSWLFQRNPLIANPSLPMLGWLLVLHALVPPHPYGSLAGQRRGTNPNWRLPAHLFLAVWVILALSYSHSGWTKLASPSWVEGNTIRLVLENPLARDHVLREWVLSTPPALLQLLTWSVMWLELLFAPLALIRRLRPWLWFAMLLAQCGFLVFLNFADLTVPMLLVHLLTFDPAWLARHEQQEPATLFFDGNCAFCHATVRLAMHEDTQRRLHFAPLNGETSRAMLRSGPRPHGDDSIVIVDTQGRHAWKSRAVAAVLGRLGGLWLVAAWVLRAMPGRLADWGYDLVGRWRYRFGGKVGPDVCIVAVGTAERLLP
jgi:predicted DCC family thiol-disulfide oxidoreductase YuxK